MAGDSVALILEYLRAHHYIKAEAALQEEVGLLQQGEEEEEEEDSPPTLLSSILNLASMASAVDRIDPVGETQASPKQDLSMEEEKSIETPHRRCIASLLVGESRCSDKKVESGDDTVEPRKSLENCGNGKTSGTLGMAHALEFDVEELPQLPPAKLYTPEKSSKDLSMEQEEKIIASPHRRRIASLLVGESRCSDKKVESGDETVNPRKSSENCGNGKMSGTLGMAHALEFNAEELPRPPPAKLDTPEKSSEEQEEKSISSPHTRHTVSPPVEENMHSDKKVESGDETVNPRKSSENCSNGKMSGTSGMAHVLEFDMEELPQLPPAKLYTPKKSAEDLSIEQEEKSIASPHRRHTASPLVEGNMHSDKKVESGDETVNPRKSSDTQEENCGGGISSTLGLTRALEFDAEELPWLPPVKLYTPEKSAEDLPMEEEEEKSIASPRRGHTPPPPLEESMNSDKTVQSGDKTVDPRKSLDIQEENCSDGTMSSSTLGLARVLEFDAEELPRLPPVKLYTSEKNAENNTKDGSGAGNSSRSFESAVSQSLGRTPSEEGDCDGATFFDVPFSQETSTSGVKQLLVRPSVSQGIIEDGSDHLSSFVTASDDESESVEDHFDEYWDSDTYEDDDDPGYIRQSIEDEFWFLANNIDYPTEDERSRNLVENSYSFLKELDKLEENASQQESVLSVEEYYRSKASNGDWLTDEHLYTRHSDQDGVSLRVDQENNLVDHLREKECFDLLGVEASQGGFKDESSRDEDNGEKKIEADNFHYGCVKSGSIASNSDPSEMETHVREIVLCSSNEGKTERVQNQEATSLRSSQTSNPNEGGTERDQDQEVTSLRYGQTGNPNEGDTEGVDDEEGTSFRSSQTSNPNDLLAETDGKCARTQAVSVGHYMNKKATEDMADGYNNEVNQQRWYARDCKAFDIVNPCEVMKNLEMAEMQARTKSVERDGFLFHPSIAGFTARDEDADEYDNEKYKLNDSSAMCKENSSESSPMASPKNDCVRNRSPLTHSDSSVHSIEVYMKTQEVDSTLDGQDVAKIQEGVEAIAAENDDDTAIEHELIQRLEMEKDEYEVFNLKIVHRKNRTGFEEDKDFPVVINSIVAGRYCVTGYLGSAAFSKAIQAHDLYSGTDVCMKIIKNNKDYFDQSLDEIKLLKYINRHDPDDKHHILRLYDYFYHREHLFIVCELLRANLYEFQKFNKESGGEVYFTMPCLQAITRQCLEALEFIHGLGLIHCDLKPENILVKSYSRCQIKVIDFGSSCFQTDHLCSYVQSRSYRAPEVILGLPYDSTIDIWSLGCILAELCSGNVLFQNDSIATLLARVVGILGPIDPDMLAEGRDTYKYFTKNHLLYERNQENGQLEYLIPKKTSLTHRLKMGDKGFVEFVQYLLHINPMERPTASEALKHKWLLHSYEQVPS